MPAEQLMDLMAANFSEFRTLVITQSIRLTDPEKPAGEKIFQEKIWLQVPELYRSELIDIPGAGTSFERKSIAYRWLLMANDGNLLLARLSDMGIRLESVTLTRLDGVIAYRIGEEGDGNPTLFIERERFLPLLVSFRVPGDRQLLTVRFDDFRSVAKGWYPNRISLLRAGEILEESSIRELELSGPLEVSLFENPEKGSSPARNIKDDQARPQKEGLREMLRFLKEKYQ